MSKETTYQYEQLLASFNELPDLETEPPTLLEISGYPHYEDVCSNILAFYFDQNEGHGLDNILLRSFLEAYPDQFEKAGSETVNKVERETLTGSNKRIDLLIETDSYCIAIENKIYAPVYNDLRDYASYMEEYASAKNGIPLKVVLSLKPVSQSELDAGFINITYATLFESLKINIGKHIRTDQNKYVQYLLDFITSIENLRGITMDPEILAFFKEHYGEIEDLIGYKKDVDGLLHKRTELLKTLIEDLYSPIDPWIYKKNTLVHDVQLAEGIVVAVDYRVNLGITLPEIFVREGRGHVDTALLQRLEIYESNRFETFLEGKRMYVRNDGVFSFESDPLAVAEQILQIVEEIRIAD